MSVGLQKKSNIKVSFVFGIISLVTAVISWMISSSVETSKWITLIRAGFITASALCYVICYITSGNDGEHRRQLSWLNVCVLVFHLILCIVTFKTAFYIRYVSQMYLEVLWIAVSCYVLWESRDSLFRSISHLKEDDNIFCVAAASVIAAVLVLLSYDVDGPRFVWDARSIYERLWMLETTDAFDIAKFFVFSHVVPAYSYSVFVLSKIVGNLALGYWIYNAMCLMVASFSVFFILKKVLINSKRSIIVLSSAACLFSPYVCGMSTYYTYDYALCCFVPLLLLFAVNGDWIYFFAGSVYVSLLKETGIVWVASVCAGVLLTELIYVKASFKDEIFRKRTVSWAFTAALFMLFYKTYAGWQDEYQGGGFGFDTTHILTTLRMFFVLNFEWLIVLTVIIMLLTLISRKISVTKYLVLFTVTACLPLLFYLAYVTEEYPRYTNAFPVCMLLIWVMLLSSADMKGYLRGCIISAMMVLMIAASFCSIDPISEAVMPLVDTGSSKVYLSYGNFDFAGDPCVYNRQYYGFDIVFNKALAKAIDSGDDLIAVSNGGNYGTWAIDGGHNSYNDMMDKRYFTEFWNTGKQSREPLYDYDLYSDEEHIPLDLRYIYPNDDIVSALQEGSTFIYLFLPSQNSGREETVRNCFDIIEEGSFESHGWVMSYIRGKQR